MKDDSSERIPKMEAGDRQDWRITVATIAAIVVGMLAWMAAMARWYP